MEFVMSRTSRRLAFGCMLGVVAALGQVSARGQELIWKSFGTNGNEQLGSALDVLGDVTGDGVPEVIASGSTDDTNGQYAGKVTVLSGADGSTVFSLFGTNADDMFGFSLAGIGDIDGDGSPDFVVGAPFVTNNLMSQGVVTAHSGKTGSVIYWVFGAKAFDCLGMALTSIGDVDGDGFTDFAVGTFATLAYVLSGKDGATLWTLSAPKSTSRFGQSMGGGGDVDGDGVPDVILGDTDSSFGAAFGGSASVFSGATGNLIFQVGSTTRYAKFGYAVAIVGDVNGDGDAEFLVGAPEDDRVTTDGGYAALYSGVDGALMMSFAQSDPTFPWTLGSAVRGVGDVNEDGVVDYVIGALSFPSETGASFLYSGRDGWPIYHFQVPWWGTGGSIGPAADFDGDGHVDYAFGTPFESYGSLIQAGSVTVLKGFEFNVDLVPHQATSYQAVDVTIAQGVAGSPDALFLRDVNGTPMFTLVRMGVLDATGRDVTSAYMPLDPGVNTIDVQAFTLDANGHLVSSGVEHFSTY